METPKVYHGTPEQFDSKEARPTRQIRTETNDAGEEVVIFDEESFHATPHKWIALAYTDRPGPIEVGGVTYQCGMGVSLHENSTTVAIFGAGSLEETLKVLYGSGGYVYHFHGDRFLYKEGLGSLEVVVNEPVEPISAERVEDPVEEMKKLGVSFEFIDLSLPENQKFQS